MGRAEKAKGASPSIDGKVDRAGKLKQVDEIEELAGNEGRFCEIRGRESSVSINWGLEGEKLSSDKYSLGVIKKIFLSMEISIGKINARIWIIEISNFFFLIETVRNRKEILFSRDNLLKRGIGRFTREKSWLQRDNIRKKNSKQPLRHAFIVVIPALNRALGGIKHPLE